MFISTKWGPKKTHFSCQEKPIEVGFFLVLFFWVRVLSVAIGLSFDCFLGSEAQCCPYDLIMGPSLIHWA